MKDRRRIREAGITLIEMLVVVTIIALFAGLVLLPMMKRVDRAKQVAAHTQISGFMTALGTYKLDTGAFPTNEQGLKALREKPEGVNGWQGPYLQKEVPTDPWKNEYQYKYPGDHGDEPDICSFGLDGKPGGEGNDEDICSWKNQ